jgi:hypothetical protein
MFERRHYQVIADTLRVARQRPNDSAAECIDDLVEDFCSLFSRDNSRFKPDTFREATAPKRGRPPLKPARDLEKRRRQAAELAKDGAQ